MTISGKPLVLLDAPTNLGLRPSRPGHEPGTRFAPTALRTAGLQAALNAKDSGVVSPPPYQFGRPRTSRIRNLDGLVAYSGQLADRVGELLDEGAFPIVVGGDCSLLLGPMLALKRRGRFGLIFIDGHSDLLTPETSATGGAAGMDLALVCGIGPSPLTNLDSLPPLVQPQDVAVLGFRDGSERSIPAVNDLMLQGALLLTLADLRKGGVESSATGAIKRIRGQGADGFWVHLDLDVLDSALMGAVDSPQPDGLSFSALAKLLAIVLHSPGASGIDITIFDPELDPTGQYARDIVQLLTKAVTDKSPPEDIDRINPLM